MANQNETEIREEDAEDRDSRPDEIDDQDTGSGSTEAKPWDPAKIRITTKHFSLRDVVDQIGDGDIDLAPDFQREYVWKARQRTRLIESILLGIPLPAFYFNQDNIGRYQVVDGVQRLSTIALFMNNNHELDVVDLEYLTGLHGIGYSRLDPAASRRFRSTQIVVHVIEPQTPDDVKYDIFSRVNTLGSPLSAQEIRHAMSRPRSRDFLKRLAESREFDTATQKNFWRRAPDVDGGWVRDSGRMTNRELALRFCAFRRYSDEEYRQSTSLDAFLVEFTKRIDQCSEKASPISDRDLAQLGADFARAMGNASAVLGRAAFRRWPPDQPRRGPINRAVFESQATALADYEAAQLAPHSEKIVSAFRAAFDNPEYARAVTVGTGDPASVGKRLSYLKEALEEIVK